MDAETQIPGSSADKPTQTERTTQQTYKFTQILAPDTRELSIYRRKPYRCFRKMSEATIPELIRSREKKIAKNILLISMIGGLVFLTRDGIINNWADSKLVRLRHVMTLPAMAIVCPLIVPKVLRRCSVRNGLILSTSLTLALLLMNYYPLPYLYVLLNFLVSLPESVLVVIIPLTMARLAKIWSEIKGIEIRTVIIRFAGSIRVMVVTRKLFLTIEHMLSPNEGLRASKHGKDLENETCDLRHCPITTKLVTNHTYGTKEITMNTHFIYIIVMIVGSAVAAICCVYAADKWQSLSTSVLGQEPAPCKIMDVLLQLCRPRVTYLLGIIIYYPMLASMRDEYIKAYAQCTLTMGLMLLVKLSVILSAIHSSLSAETLTELLGRYRVLRMAIVVETTIFVLLACCLNLENVSVSVHLFLVYVLEYWILNVDIHVFLMTEELIGDEEVAAWTLQATLYYFGKTLRLTYLQMCMRAKLTLNIICGIVILVVLFFMQREENEEFVPTSMDADIANALRSRGEATIDDSHTNLEDVLKAAKDVGYIVTFLSRKVELIDPPENAIEKVQKRAYPKKFSAWTNFRQKFHWPFCSSKS